MKNTITSLFGFVGFYLPKKGMYYSCSLIICLAFCQTISAQPIKQKTSKPPAGFVENQGQIIDQNHQLNPAVRYLLNLPGLNVQLKANSFSYDTYVADFKKAEYPETYTPLAHEEDLYNVSYRFHRIDIEFIGAASAPEILAENVGKDYFNFYTTGTPEAGVTNVKHYGKVTYKDLYRGIDLEFITTPGTSKPVEYNFIVHPGADVSQIKWRYKGSGDIKLVNDEILLKTAHGNLVESIPLTFEKESNKTVDVKYKALGEGVYGFLTPNYNHQNTLIIDPLPDLKWGTYLGGSGIDYIYGITTDDAGNSYVTGSSTTAAGIATSGSYQSTYAGGTGYGAGGDVIIIKFDASGVQQWATYFGDSGNEQGLSIGIDKSNNLYISGSTSSATGMATTGAFQTSEVGSYNDAFLAKFTSSGMRIWGTYYGGTGNDRGAQNGLAVDADANVYFTGTNNTANNTHITTAGAYKTTNGSTSAYDDPFVAKFDSSGTRIWGTYCGGPLHDIVGALAIDNSRNVYITGHATSTSQIATTGAFQTTYGGGNDAFIAKLNSTGTALLWGTYYGGSSADVGTGIAVDGENNVILGGYTAGSSGLASSGAFQTSFGGGTHDAFVAKFDSLGTRLWATYFGESDREVGRSLAADPAGNIFLAADVATTSGIATSDAFQTVYGGGTLDAFIVKFDKAGTRVWGTYYGGNGEEIPWNVNFDKIGNVYLVGRTASSTGVASTGAHQTTYGGGTFDGFITKFQQLAGANNAGVNKFKSPSSFMCAGNHDIKVEIMNSGLDTIKTLDIEWMVDGVAQTKVNITTPLPPGASREMTLGNINFPANTVKAIKAYTSLPNNTADTVNDNDTIQIELRPGLNGTYTIGGTSPDYADFSTAVADLNSYGACGPVVFNVAGSTFSENISINPIQGSSSTNTILFKGAGKTSTVLTYAGTNTSDMATLLLNGADHITFRDMSIENTGSTYGAGVWLTGGADSNRFVNLNIDVDATASSNNVNGIIGSGSATSISDGATGSYNLFDSLEITGGYYGFRFSGVSTTLTYAEKNIISNSTFKDQYQFGIYLRSQSYPTVSRLNISGLRSTTSYGIYIEYSSNLEVANNEVTANDYGLYFNYLNTSVYNSGFNSRIYNNMVSSSGDYALYSNQSRHLKLWHNSFSADPTHSVMRFVGSQNIDLTNNHVHNASTSGSIYVLHADNLNTFLAMDYNNYFSSGNFVFIGSSHYANLPVLQAGISQFNQNSSDRDPSFQSATDLHTSINISGVYVGIDEDIDGDFRNTISPVIGADEVNIPNNAGTAKILTPSPVFCAGTHDLEVRIGNYGVNVIDSVRVYWQVNGTLQGVSYVSSQIALRGFVDVNLGSLSFTAGESKNIKVWTAMPNGVNDSLRNNDTLSITLKTGMSGTYTIGGTTPDYADFNEAVFDLNVLGVCGPVVFNVAAGTFNERVVIGEVTGASATNTISFIGAGKSNTVLSNSGSSNGDWITLLLDGADHTRFRDMTVSAMGANYGIGILLTGQADSNRFENMILQSSLTSNSSNLANIVLMESTTDMNSAAGQPGDGNMFDSLEVNGGYYGIYLVGNNSYTTISRSVFKDQNLSAIFAGNQDYLEISHNKLNPVRSTTFSSLSLTMVSNFRLHNNNVHASGEFGISIMLANFLGSDPNFPSQVYNNMISNTSGYAWYVDGLQDVSIFHNSFRSVGSSASITSACYFTNSSGIDMRNNQIRNDNPNSFALESENNAFDSLDYNNYFSFGSFVKINTEYNNLSELQNGYVMFNQNSYSQDPRYISLTNLHTSSFLPGIYVGIDHDIDGESRCPQTVSIGADDENQGFTKPAITTDHTDFYTNYPVRFSHNISSLPSIEYEWYVDGNYITDSVSFQESFATAGPHTVKLKAQRCIHHDSAEFVINVLSGTPVITLLGNDPDSFRVFTSYQNPGADAVDFFNNNISASIMSGNNIDSSILGTYYMWYTVEDMYGNRDSVTRAVYVIDDVAPVITLTGPDTLHIEVFTSINDPGATATDNYYSSVVITVDSSGVNKNVVGVYEMIYTATDASGNFSTATRYVKISDTQKPVITLVSTDTVIIKVHFPYVEAGAKVQDNYCKTGISWDVDVYPNTSVLGDYLLTYTAEDCEGNQAIPVTRLVRVIDNESPVLSLRGLPIIYIQRWTPYNESGVNIRDNYYSESELQPLLQVTSDVNVDWIGNYSVCYEVTDPSGNLSNQICRAVHVIENTTGIDKKALEGFKLYPNPSKGQFTISLSEIAEADMEVTVTDVAGRVVHVDKLMQGQNELHLNLAEISAGIYQVSMQQDQLVKTIKISIIK